jgi:hypothetical protein
MPRLTSIQFPSSDRQRGYVQNFISLLSLMFKFIYAGEHALSIIYSSTHYNTNHRAQSSHPMPANKVNLIQNNGFYLLLTVIYRNYVMHNYHRQRLRQCKISKVQLIRIRGQRANRIRVSGKALLAQTTERMII